MATGPIGYKKTLGQSRVYGVTQLRTNGVHFFCSFFPVQQTTSGIGHRVKEFFRVGKQYAECEKQHPEGGCSEGLDTFRFFLNNVISIGEPV